MSAPLAGKFQDHYAVLGVEPKADSDAIQAAYVKLAGKFNPKGDTPDAVKFEAVNLAYETLSDAGLRAQFDKIKGVGQEDRAPVFDAPVFFDALGRGWGLRSAVLCVLYDRRRTKPFTPSLSVRHLEGMLTATEEELNFALWYLKQRSYVVSDDKSSLQITVEGMDFLEGGHPSPEVVMPFVKAAAQPGAPEAAPTEPLPAAELAVAVPASADGVPVHPESLRELMRRTLAKVRDK